MSRDLSPVDVPAEILLAAYREGYGMGQMRHAVGPDMIDEQVHRGYLETAESHGPAADPVEVQRAIGYRDGFRSVVPESVRKKKGHARTKLLTIRMDEKELKDFHRLARRNGLTASSYIRHFVYKELAKLRG